ncbi:MAG: hypothetical protein HYU66_16945 [Armatimonadetes bacterium]|nr:hypothetical protein [Armatimonadota bacterium]
MRLVLLSLVLALPLAAEPPWDTRPDTWVATDALGRTLPTAAEAGPPRPDRTVGIFYFLWLGAHVNGGPWDVSRILTADPGAMQKPDSPLWGPMGAMHHWGRPLLGYYQTNDAYVVRKHAQMLSDAGVDVVIFDVTNQITYKPWYTAVFTAFEEVRAAGGKTPQVAFLTPFWDPAKVAAELYHDLYEPKLFDDLWFKWDGKPLLLADLARLGETFGTAEHDTPARLEPGHTLGQSFTLDRPCSTAGGCFPTWSSTGGSATLTLRRDGPEGGILASRRCRNVPDNTWLAVKPPQPLPPGRYYLELSEPTGTVGWWSHTGNVLPNGVAFADGRPVAGDRTLRCDLEGGPGATLRAFFTFRKPQPSYFQGPTQPDEWSWLEVAPQHVFLNAGGEKEQMSVGVAQNAVGERLGSMSEVGARGRSYHHGALDTRPGAVNLGLNVAEQWEHALKEDPRFVFVTGWNEWIASRYNEFAGIHLPVMFVDTFDEEHSRDIEPMAGGHGDSYYYQMAAYIRRYKGVRPLPAAGPPRTIRLDRGFLPWAAVTPEYRDDRHDETRRDHPGYNHCEQLVNATGRNDIVAAKVAWDRTNLWFYARTREPLTHPTDTGWMLLFLDVDSSHATGWEGYDYVIGRPAHSATRTVLEANAGGWAWRAKAELPLAVAGNELMLAVRRVDLGLRPGAAVRLDFKWADNTQVDGNVDAFTLNGDAAPNGRFNYRFTAPAVR